MDGAKKKEGFKSNEGNMKIMVHVHDKVIVVSCGTGSQCIQWLGCVGIARYDEENLKGWIQLGRHYGLEWFDIRWSITVGKPLKITLSSGVVLNSTDAICEVLQDKEHVYIETSRKP